MQIIIESMLEITYEIENLNSLIIIIEIESNSNEDENTTRRIVSFIELSNSDLENQNLESKEKKNFYLSSFSSSDMHIFSTFEINTSRSYKLGESSNSSSSSSSFSTSIDKLIKKMIDLNINTINILSERMRRSRIRKQTYLIALSQNFKQSTAYHSRFSTFANANLYYENKHDNQIKSSVQKFIQIKSLNQRLHRDILFSKLKNFRQMIKHSHFVDFNHVIRTKINALRVKNT
jgi:hypothetical protein